MIRSVLAVTAAIMTAAASIGDAAAGGDPERGMQVFRACASCHSLEQGRHLTGPSLAGLWRRKAGTVASFPRYSAALKESGIVWTAETLDPWLEDPSRFIPGNRMTFPGIADGRARADLTAFLEAATGAANGATAQADEPMMPMPGMGANELPDLKTLGPDNLVADTTYCGDTYTVMTKAGETLQFWEFNLRFKTDSSDLGPAPGRPALMPAGMGGDRASMIFATPEEISRAIKHQC